MKLNDHLLYNPVIAYLSQRNVNIHSIKAYIQIGVANLFIITKYLEGVY